MLDKTLDRHTNAPGTTLPRITLYAFITLAVVFVLDHVLTGAASPGWTYLADLLHSAWSATDPARNVAGDWLATRSWRPFLIATGGTALFCLFVLRNMPRSRARSIIDFIGSTCAALFVIAGTLYGAYVLTDSWHSAKLVAGVLVLFFVGALLRRQ